MFVKLTPVFSLQSFLVSCKQTCYNYWGVTLSFTKLVNMVSKISTCFTFKLKFDLQINIDKTDHWSKIDLNEYKATNVNNNMSTEA